jgi:branched-chain amino acid transport system substrate-binding protein
VIAGVVYALVPSDQPKPPPPPPSARAACGYKIAYLGILSGSNRGDGETIRNATRLALDRYNNDHEGCTTELVQYDTKGNADEAARLADEIARDDKILGVVGPVFYAESQKVMPILNAAGVTVIAPSLSYPTLSQQDWRTFHRIIGTDLDQAAAGAKYLTSNLRAQKVFIVADNDEHGVAVANEARLRLNTAAAGRADITGQEKDFASVVTQITSATANAVYLATYYDAAIILVKQIRAARPDVKILGWDRIFTDAFITGAGKDAEGVIMTCPCMPPSEARENFAAEYKSHFTYAGYFGPEAYDAANVLLAALNAGKATRADVLKFVDAYDREGVARRIKFTDKGDLSTPPNVWAYVVRGGGVTKDQAITV